MVKCPRCGGSGGVDLISRVDPCEPCYQKSKTSPATKTSGRFLWMKVDGGRLPVGTVAHNSWVSSAERDRAFETLPKPAAPIPHPKYSDQVTVNGFPMLRMTSKPWKDSIALVDRELMEKEL